MEEACPLTLFSRRRYLSSRDVYQSFLETILRLSGSQIGYLHLVNQDEIALTVWSQKVFEMCMLYACSRVGQLNPGSLLVNVGVEDLLCASNAYTIWCRELGEHLEQQQPKRIVIMDAS